MMNRLKLLWIRIFKILSKEQAEQLGLTFYRNVYGDEINQIDCRSLWTDHKGRMYRVKELLSDKEEGCVHYWISGYVAEPIIFCRHCSKELDDVMSEGMKAYARYSLATDGRLWDNQVQRFTRREIKI